MAVRKRKLQVTWQITESIVSKIERLASKRGIAKQAMAEELIKKGLENG